MLFLYTLVVSLAIVSSVPLDDFDSEWKDFQVQFRRHYKDSEELTFRKKVFQANLEDISKHNAEFEAGQRSYKKEVNQFTDKTNVELRSSMGLSVPSRNKLLRYSAYQTDLYRSDDAAVPESIDYRELGAVTPVKDQRGCGSCWAFAAIGAIEGHYFLATKKLVSFSEQQLVDCSQRNDGCDGGFMSNAFEDLKRMGGIAPNESYPYKGRDLKCTFKKKMAMAKIKGYKYIKDDDEKALKEAVALHGPVSVAIQATHSFFTYSEGIFQEDKCDGEPDHAVLIVGYGSKNGSDYWIVKNSWGKQWGEDGYIRISRNGNTCNTPLYATVPIVKPIVS